MTFDVSLRMSRARAGTRPLPFAIALPLVLLISCGGTEPASSDGSGDPTDAADTPSDALGDASQDGRAEDVPEDALTPDSAQDSGRDVSDTRDEEDGSRDVQPSDTRDDVQTDTLDDVDADENDTSDVEPDAGRVFTPGTLPLPDYIGCDENSDCPNGTGNCITSLTLNRGDESGRLRIPVSEVFPGLDRSGICTLDCVVSAAACSTLALTVDPAPWTCQVVYADESPYPTGEDRARPPFPFADQLDPGDMAAGPAFGAICRPPFERSVRYAPDFCAECSSSLNCHPGSACISATPWGDSPDSAGFCLSPCDDGTACPSGFTCRQPDSTTDALLDGDDSERYCFPTLGTCSSCVDADNDGFGVGACADSGGTTGVDCDDTDPFARWQGPVSTHAFPDVCGPDEDANCNGLDDRSEQVGTVAFGTAHCGDCGDTCNTSAPQASTFECVRLTAGIEGTCRPVCDEPTQFFDCDGVPENGCEAEVTDANLLFVPDCDRDGIGRANFPPQFDCAASGNFVIFTDVDGDDTTDDRRECSVVLAVPTDGSGFGADCNDGDGAISPFGIEVCDGIDNDCDGATDPYELFQLGDSCVPADPTVRGACRAGATRACDGTGGVTCQPAAPSVELCDGIDNDCDGLIDNLGAATPENRLGEACRASEDPGPCGAGALICQGGGLVCSPALLPERDIAGDGNDADCDGVDADTERAIFVAIGGASNQAAGAPPLGSPSNPVGTLARAFELIRVREAGPMPVEQVILTGGDYQLPHGIRLDGDDVGFTMIGGWTWDIDTNSWTPPSSARSTIEFSSVCPCAPAIDSTGACVSSSCAPLDGVVAAVHVTNPSGVRLSHLNLLVATQPVTRGPVAGLACSAEGPSPGACSGLEVNQTQIELDNASPGQGWPSAAASGSAGAQATLPAIRCLPPTQCNEDGGVGGVSACGAVGGNGGGYSGGSIGRCFRLINVGYRLGQPGSFGLPIDIGGQGGVSGFFNTLECLDVLQAPGNGTRGLTRTVAGAGGTAGQGAIASPPLSPRTATAGVAGLSGGGGGGGGAMGPYQNTAVNPFGGGGSSGGCGGSGGAAGGNGGTIIGLLIDDPTSAPLLSSVDIQVGSGGNGGAGQAGGAGGTGIGPADQSAQTIGGAGGHGAGGGGGGGGAGGSAIGIARWSTVPVRVTPTVGTAGSGGPGGAAGVGGAGGIRITLAADSTVFETAASGNAGAPGAPGVSARFCSLDPGAPPAGEVSCR